MEYLRPFCFRAECLSLAGRQRCRCCPQPVPALAVPRGAPRRPPAPAGKGSPVAGGLSGGWTFLLQTLNSPVSKLRPSSSPSPAHPLILLIRQNGGDRFNQGRGGMLIAPGCPSCAAESALRGRGRLMRFSAWISIGFVSARGSPSEIWEIAQHRPARQRGRLQNACYLINLLEHNIARNTSEISPDVPLCVSSTLMWTKSMESEVRCSL